MIAPTGFPTEVAAGAGYFRQIGAPAEATAEAWQRHAAQGSAEDGTEMAEIARSLL